ncbi:MAG: type I-U CRISPR-associated protein Csx17, partial [Acidimicrobiia bacterium]|nr:type I-U CRISPR-associated protein Csx17 [Acidimicrobiia bacterium]
MTVVALVGCRTTPLLSYLQALGVLRILHEQCAPELTSYWDGSSLHIESDLTQETISRFFVGDYEPTPMLSPWNGGGGFRTLKHEKGEQAVAQIESSGDSRLASFRAAISAARRVWDRGRRDGWLEEKLEEKTGGTKKYKLNVYKATFLAACRAAFPDEALDWLDAVVVLTDAKKPQFPLLLGTGGNLGRLDLATSYMEAVSDLLDPAQVSRSTELLSHALFGNGRPAMDAKAVGQYSPASAGTMNSSAFGSAQSVSNLWSIVLGMEGALFFVSGIARRFGGSKGLATMPFTVSGDPAGYSAAEGETVKGEFWAPIWQRSMTVPELRRVIAEGRLSWRGKQAANGLAGAKALRTLGVVRGLSHFERYVIAVRFGQAPLAAPVGSFVVTRNPADRVSLLRTPDTWLARVPRAAGSAMRRVDSAQLEVTQKPDSPAPLQNFLVELAALEWIISRNPKLAKAAGRPIPPLSHKRWGPELDDGSPEWRLAAALATQQDHLSPRFTSLERQAGTASTLLRPVTLPETHRNQFEWQ